jgi:hypothetical protein
VAKTVLVIGATGILGPAAAAFTARGDDVIGVSRSGRAGSIGVDAADAHALSAALAERSWDDALVYRPAVSDASLAFVRSATPGRCVQVRTSAAADPALGILVIPRDTLQLGWTGDPERRWHTPAEVSCAALEVLADGRPRTLGAVRPWSDRP